MSDREVTIDRRTLEVLLQRAQRQLPETGEERRAEIDAREVLENDFQAAFPVGPEQLTLFDPSSYEV